MAIIDELSAHGTGYSHAAEYGEMVSNTGFGSNLDDWTVSDGTSSTWQTEDGNGYLRTIGDGAGTEQVTSPLVAITPGDSITISARVWGLAAGVAHIAIDWYDEDQVFLATSTAADNTLTSTWEAVSTTQSNGSAFYASARLYITNNSSSTIRFDDVNMTGADGRYLLGQASALANDTDGSVRLLTTGNSVLTDSAFISVADHADFDFFEGTAEWTVAHWAKVDSDDNGFDVFSPLWSKDDAQPTLRLDWYNNPEKLQFQRDDGTDDLNETVLPSYDVWHFFVVTYDGAQTVVYVDGRQATAIGGGSNPDAATQSHGANTADILFGGSQPGITANFDEEAAWNRRLTAEEVADLWEIGIGRWPRGSSYDSLILSGVYSATHYYPFREFGDVTAFDLTGNDDGTFTGAYTLAFCASALKGVSHSSPLFTNLVGGGDGYVTVPDSANHDFMNGTTEMTVNVWVRRYAGEGGVTGMLFQHYEAGVGGYRFEWDHDNDEIVFTRSSDVADDTVTIDEPADLEWHMLSGKYNTTDDEISVYFDGQLATPKTGDNPAASTLDAGTPTDPVTIMGDGTAGATWTGSNVSMHDIALTTTQIRDLYDARFGRNARGSMMLRGVTGSKQGVDLIFTLGSVDKGFVLPFDLEGSPIASTKVLPFILDGDGAAGPNGYRDLSIQMVPTGYWTFDESGGLFTDTIGAVDGSLIGNVQRNVHPAAVPLGKMVTFPDASGAYIDFGDNHPYNATASFTWTGWFFNDGQDSDAPLVTKDDATDGYIIQILTDETMRLTRSNSGGTDTTTTASGLAISAWSHIAATYDGSDLRIYINGTLDAGPIASSRSIAIHADSLKLGGSTTSTLSGSMDEWATYASALSSDQIWTLSQARTNAPGDESEGFILGFDLFGNVGAESELPFSILDASTGVHDGVVLGPLTGWHDPVIVKSLTYAEAARSADSCCGYWRLGESSGTVAADHLDGVALAYVGTPTLGVAGALKGVIDTAVLLNGSTQWMRYTSVTAGDYLHAGDTISLVVWFKRGAAAVLEELYCAGTGGLEVGFDASDQPFAGKEGTGDFFNTTTTVADTAWHMLAVTKAAATRAMYLDGVALTNSAGDQTLTDTTGDIYIGRHQPSSIRHFTGTVDEVSLYAAALTPAVVADLYRRGRG